MDVVIGYFEPHGRQETIALTEGWRRSRARSSSTAARRFEEMDTDAVLRRRPQVAVVDEFPHTNVPGSARAKRWEDVHVLLDAGIDVLTTMNVQHLESLNDQIWQSTGVRVRETIPGLGAEAGRRSRDGGPDAAGAAQPPGARRRLPAGAGPRRAARISSRNRRSSRCASSRCGRRRTPSRAGCRTNMRSCRRRRSMAGSSTDDVLLLVAHARSVERRAYPTGPPRRRLPARRVPGGVRVEDRHLRGAGGPTSAKPSSGISTSPAACRSKRGSLQGTDDAPSRSSSFARRNGVTQIFVTREKPSALRSWFASALRPADREPRARHAGDGRRRSIDPAEPLSGGRRAINA